MKQFLLAASVLALLAACGDGQPFFEEETTDDTTGDDGSTDGSTDDGSDEGTNGIPSAQTPASMDVPTPDSRIVRFEQENEDGGGMLISPVVYDEVNDRFFVDNMAFDGNNVYQRILGSQMPYSVYEASATAPDALTGDDIRQVTPYSAIVGVSRNRSTNSDGESVPRTAFAIVRTGGYVDYGFGGFVYQREGAFEVPTTGQAIYTGDYGGVRVFEGSSGLEYVDGKAEVRIDFEDFNRNEGVYARVYDRTILNPRNGQLNLPTVAVPITVGDGGFDENGEYMNTMSSVFIDPDTGEQAVLETGNLYAIIAGDATSGNGGEIVGVVTLTSDDPRTEYSSSTETFETGGFIAYRGADNFDN
ncbi:hypothetical protein [Pelagovum pacificum]|uniref:Transferrin-binding protein-like solute binding protein n=1 Tax=Pelagovum pacificum TaxID=2588711 RepID=A0A5C5GAB6_9RHOB|nr:hypothetical protein [Pelagovum pacificum]QQA41631.1 hypothetical protein I8N54_12470 [Pelagovum pacificum]TNY30910.1 hypothetical protein FHY64_17545 [Pelagovum pacificum]